MLGKRLTSTVFKGQPRLIENSVKTVNSEVSQPQKRQIFTKKVFEVRKIKMTTNGVKHLSTTSAEDDFYVEKILDLVKANSLTQGRKMKETGVKVVEFMQPRDLEAELGTKIDENQTNPLSKSELDTLSEKVVKYSVKTNHPHFHNQLYHGVDSMGLAGSWLSDALNTNNHTYEVAPVFIVTEKAVLRYFMDKFGWGQDEGDGIFSPGGSLSNMYGMILARHRLLPEIKTKGLVAALNGKVLVAYTSEESHYSIVKGANWLGIGVDNVIKIKTDLRGRMIPEELEKAILKTKGEGNIPFFVNATAGSTVMGAYDQFSEIADVCKRQGDVWMHTDACWGGGSIMSKPRKEKWLTGIERSDSIAFNPHKMLGAPLQASPFITKHRGLLASANAASATYLFQQDKHYDMSYDTGDKAVQCGRKVDGFKTWFMMKARGEKYFENLVENAYERAETLFRLVSSTEGFEPAFPEFGYNFTNVCFYYIPKRLRGQERTKEWWAEVAKVAPKVKEEMMINGSMMIGYQPLGFKNRVNFFRMVIHCQPAPTDEDMQKIVSEIDKLGKDL